MSGSMLSTMTGEVVEDEAGGVAADVWAIDVDDIACAGRSGIRCVRGRGKVGSGDRVYTLTQVAVSTVSHLVVRG